MREDQLKDFYWKILKIITGTRKELKIRGIDEAREYALLYRLAYAGLLRFGVHFQMQERYLGEAPNEKKLGFITVTTQKEEIAATVTHHITIRDEDGTFYEIGEEELRKVMFDDFDRVVLKIGSEETEQKESEPLVPNFVIPDFQEENQEGEQQVDTEDKKEEPDKGASNESDDPMRLPTFVVDKRYKNDSPGKKKESTFLYNRHDLSIDDAGNTGTISFYVYPLSVKMNEKATDIMVVAESGEMCRASISRGFSSAVEIEFAEVLFVVRGSFIDGEFCSQVNVLKEGVRVIENQCQKHQVLNKTSTTFVRQEYENIQFNIFPAKYGNNGSKGYAPAAIAMERNNGLEILTPTSEGVFVINGSDGVKIVIETYWIGDYDPEFRVNIEKDDF